MSLNLIRKGKRLANGALVIDYKIVHDKHYVLALWEKGRSNCEYVSWQVNPNDASTYYGHYFPDLIDAVKDFANRGY